jgi:hypothetical protein
MFASVGVQAAAADSPDVQVLEDHWEGLNGGLTDDCGFDVWEVGSQQATITQFYDADGTPSSITVHLKGRFVETNVATGRSVVQTFVRNVRHAFSGSPIFTGSVDKVSEPHGRVLSHDAGYLSWQDPDGTIVKVAGPHPSFFDGTDWCSLLSAS